MRNREISCCLYNLGLLLNCTAGIGLLLVCGEQLRNFEINCCLYNLASLFVCTTGVRLMLVRTEQLRNREISCCLYNLALLFVCTAECGLLIKGEELRNCEISCCRYNLESLLERIKGDRLAGNDCDVKTAAIGSSVLRSACGFAGSSPTVLVISIPFCSKSTRVSDGDTSIFLTNT